MTTLAEVQREQNKIDSEPRVACPICGGNTRYIGCGAATSINGKWHDSEIRACDECEIEFSIDENRELSQGTICPRFGTPENNRNIERHFWALKV